jgi:hypothetical protein
LRIAELTVIVSANAAMVRLVAGVWQAKPLLAQKFYKCPMLAGG